MNESDAFFTQTIVGAPFSVVLGRRLGPKEMAAAGLEVNLKTGTYGLSETWQDWLVLDHTTDKPGRTRRLPGKGRLWMERHALWLAWFGLLSLLASGAFWALQSWL
ncbi:hypothetical protein [Hydrogenophaga sp.]|uniref:hypothetical protein n=1 Tax=Hydrogenophaga sp. TaxID=1904254 RepID=UPI002728C362|nr:hypothetical protein [Hydrogenophaga sp.]MDO8904578.1 hypothetical protein [Hydrogenophaga sp.]